MSLDHLLVKAQVPIFNFSTGPDFGLMSNEKISSGTPSVMQAFGIYAGPLEND